MNVYVNIEVRYYSCVLLTLWYILIDGESGDTQYEAAGIRCCGLYGADKDTV